MPAYALLDLETTALDTRTAEIIEIGMVLWDSELHSLIDLYSTLVSNRRINPETERITGITQEHIDRLGVSPAWAFSQMIGKIDRSRAVALVAHNGLEYDYPILERELVAHGLQMPRTALLDTKYDLPYPPHMRKRSLEYLRQAHGYAHPYRHRALPDALSITGILVHYDLEQALEDSKSPMVHVSTRGFKSIKEAGDFGYYPRGDYWRRRLREAFVPAELVYLQELGVEAVLEQEEL